MIIIFKIKKLINQSINRLIISALVHTCIHIHNIYVLYIYICTYIHTYNTVYIVFCNVCKLKFEHTNLIYALFHRSTHHEVVGLFAQPLTRQMGCHTQTVRPQRHAQCDWVYGTCAMHVTGYMEHVQCM